MTVHINGSKGKDLYYGGTKIKEAYYNGNKVYSSGPLYYCYRSDVYGYWAYSYLVEKPTASGYITCYRTSTLVDPASTSADLTDINTYSIQNVTDSQFQWTAGGGIAYYYPDGDLYT